VILALVSFETSSGGAISRSGNVAHWVRVTKLQDGQVFYYDPYSNMRGKRVPEEEFEDAWKATPGNSGSFISVEAWR